MQKRPPAAAIDARAAALEQREQALRQREQELAEQRRVVAEEYRLMRARMQAPAATARQQGFWSRLKRIMLGVSAS